MAAKAWGSQRKSPDEVFVQNEAFSLCLLMNRRARTMRVVDFRAGATTAKRRFVHSLAEREGVQKIYTLVERDEVQTWVKLGFTKEGNIPGFYKRSDAFLLGSAVLTPGALEAHAGKEKDDVPLESQTRIVAAHPVGGPPAVSAAHDVMERTIVAGKRGLRDLAEKPLPHAKVSVIDEADARRAAASAARTGRALSAFEPFGRDVRRQYFAATVRGGFELIASTESQLCFGNAFLELLTSPRNDAEKAATAASLHALCERLLADDVVSCFSLAPSGDVALATAFLHSGFRRTGLLQGHLPAGAGGKKREDAILWSRKLSNPADE